MWSVLVVISVLSAETGTWVSFQPEADEPLAHSGEPETQPTARVLEHSDSRTVVEVTVPGVREERKVLDGREFSFLSFPLEADFLEVEGKPGLPVIRKWVAIPHDKNVSLKVLSHKYSTLKGYLPVPSQDVFKYQKEGLAVDHTFYSTGSTYPGKIATVSSPEILRDYRYVVLTFHPVRYNPLEDETHVYSSIRVELTYSGSGKADAVEKRRNYTSHAFEPLYRHHFINYDHVKFGKAERGTYLVLVPDAYYNSILPLADWRHRKGMQTKVVKLSEIGDPITDVLIRNYVIDACNAWDVPPEYVLLVGDIETLPHHPGSLYSGSRATNEPWLAPNCMVSRISVDNTTELDAVVSQIVDYERDPYLGETAWYRKAMTTSSSPFGVLGNGGPARDKLLAYGFTHVDVFEDADTSATRGNITNAVNDGRLIAMHWGHGSYTAWYLKGTNTFGKTQVGALTNGRKMPMLFSGG
jgi:hypothetical protein